jgi:hypothetical protein
LNIYSNIRIFILLNKLPILANISKKNQNCDEITDFLVLGLICTQMGQQITKLDLLDVFVNILEKLPESRHLLMVYFLINH